KEALANVESEAMAQAEAEAEAAPATHPALAFVLGGFFLVAFDASWWAARGWPQDARFFPDVVSAAGVLFSCAVLVHSGRQLAQRRHQGPILAAEETASILSTFGFLVASIVASILFGQLIALPL